MNKILIGIIVVLVVMVIIMGVILWKKAKKTGGDVPVQENRKDAAAQSDVPPPETSHI